MHITPKSLLLAGSVLVSGQAFAQQDQVYIKSLSWAGSGCSPGTASGSLDDVDKDGLKDQFKVLFSTFIAEQPGTTLKDCSISLTLHIPQGFQYSIASVDYEGAASLPKGVAGQQKSTYEFPLHSNEITFQTVIHGPWFDKDGFPKDYHRRDEVGLSSIVWSKCGLDTPLEIETRVALAGNKNLPAIMTLNNVDGKVEQIYGLVWKPCKS